MTFSKSLALALVSLLPFGVLAPGCSSDATAQKGQLISCSTDPSTGVVLSCHAGEDDGEHVCHDLDTNGDGEPQDTPDDNPTVVARHGDDDGDDHDMNDDHGDHDHDGIPDDDDCDHHPGEDDGGDSLPYDVRPAKGSTTAPVADAFADAGFTPAEILSINGATWRIDELRAGAAFVVEQADCDHAGNRDTGRDRVVVQWRNDDGSVHADHLDIRYCKN